MIVKGVNGQVELTEHKVIIHRKGILVSHRLRGRKEIFLSSLSGVQLKEAGLLTNGYIEFIFSGGKEHQGSILKAAQNENCVFFNKKQQKEFVRLKEEIERRILEIRNQPSRSNHSSVEELERLAKLKEQGVITEEEFLKMKKQILGE